MMGKSTCTCTPSLLPYGLGISDLEYTDTSGVLHRWNGTLRKNASKHWPESVVSSTASGMTLSSWIHQTLMTAKELL